MSVLQNLLVQTINISNSFGENKDNNNEKNININDIKNNMEKILIQLDLTIFNFYNYHDLVNNNKINDYSFEEEQISSFVYGDNIYSMQYIIPINIIQMI